MLWRKLGLVFCASGQNEFMQSGGRTPVPLHLHDDIYRIYFGAYDKSGRGRIFSLEMDINKPQDIYNLVERPYLDIGATGFFDDNGIIPSDILRIDNMIYLYTIGFSIKNRLIFDAASGLALSRDGGKTFTKFTGPVLDRGVDDPCFAASPCVLRLGDKWHMWYVSCDHWEPCGSGFKHYYNIKHRISTDGIYWDSHADVCIDFANEYEYAISRPSVLCTPEGRYRMWFSFRAQPGVETYRIGYAESSDGVHWIRMDEKMRSFDVSESGWDSEMVCYPKVFMHKEKIFMLYNGNHYGKTGFGLAVLEDA